MCANFFVYFWKKTKETTIFAPILAIHTQNIYIIIMQISGKIIFVLPERGGVSQRTGTEWKAASYVLQTFEQYPKKVFFDVFGSDRIQQFNIQAGQDLTIDIDIDAHEYNGRWFNSVRAFRVAPYDPAQALAQPAQSAMPGMAPQPVAAPQPDAPFPPAQPQAAAPIPPMGEGESGDDLPF